MKYRKKTDRTRNVLKNRIIQKQEEKKISFVAIEWGSEQNFVRNEPVCLCRDTPIVLMNASEKKNALKDREK